MLDRFLVETEDGSSSIYIPDINEHYHSIHGAVQESDFVYIKNGFDLVTKEKIRVFEVGFGTGLNAWLTMLESEKSNRSVEYHSIEKYPLNSSEYENLNYFDKQNQESKRLFGSLHASSWGELCYITPNFGLKKIEGDLLSFDFLFPEPVDLVYYDAFSPEKQPSLWTTEIFEKIYNACSSNAILSTYCAKGQVRRNLVSVGFKVDRLPGPPGKREILLALKP